MDEEDEDSDNGQQEGDESDPERDEIDRRVAQMIEDRNRQNQLHNTSSQMLRLLSHFLPGVPPNAQVVELESVSDESGTSSSSTTSSSPTSDENTETPTCVIWAEPIMSCQLPPSGPLRCDDVRRLPPGVKPDDVKKYQASRGLASGLAPAADDDTGSHQPSMRSTCQSERKNNNYSVVTQTSNTNIPQSTSLNSRHADSNTPLDNFSSGHGSSGGGAGASDEGISSFGATHNDLNDAMMRITEAANTIRMAREMLSSLNLNRQLNNSNPDTTNGDNDGKDEKHKPQHSSREDMDTKTESLPRSQESVGGNCRAREQQSPSGSSTAKKTESVFPEPILVRELPDSDSEQKDGDSKAARDRDSKGDGKCLSSTLSTESEDSGISRSTIASLPVSDTGRTQQTSIRNRENFTRRIFDPNRMSWSSNMTRAAYQAARIARFPRIYGPVFRRAASSSTYNSLNRNQQSTTLASNIENRHVPTLSTDVAQSRRIDNPVITSATALPEVSNTPLNSINDSPRPLSRSRGAGNQKSRSRFSGGESQRMRRDLGELKFDIDTMPMAQKGDGVRLKKPITLDDVKKALDMVITNLKKTDAWALSMTNVNDESCARSKSNANAFALSQTQATNSKTQQSDISGDKSNTQSHNEPITRVEKAQIGQSNCSVLEQGYRQSSNEQDNDTNEGDENSGSAGTLNLRVARLQYDSENSKSASVGSPSSSSVVRQNKRRVIMANKLVDQNSLDIARKLSPATSNEPCGILMHDKQTASPSGIFSGREGGKSLVTKRKKVEFAESEESQTEGGDDDNTVTGDLTRIEKDFLNDFSSPQSKAIKMTASELVISTLTQTIGDVDYLAPREYASEINLDSQSQSIATQSEYMYGMSDYSFRDDSFKSPKVKFRTDTDIKNNPDETALLRNADENSHLRSEYQDKSGNTSYNDDECESSEEAKARDTYLGDGSGICADKHEQKVSAYSLPQAVASSDTEKAETSEAMSEKDPNTSNSTNSDTKCGHLPTSNEQCELSDGPTDDTTSQDDSGEECVSMRSISVGTSLSGSINPFGRRVKRMFLTVSNPRPPRNTFVRKSLDTEQKPLTALQEDMEHPASESRASDREARPVSESVTRKESRSTVNIADQTYDGDEISKKEIMLLTQSTDEPPCGIKISDEKTKFAYGNISIPTCDLSEKEILDKEMNIAQESIDLPVSENDISEKEISDKKMKIAYKTIELPASENDTLETIISDKEMNIGYETIELATSENEISEKGIPRSSKKIKIAYETLQLPVSENDISEKEIAYETIELPASENDMSEKGILDEEIKVAYESIAISPSENEIAEKKTIQTTEMVQQLQFGDGISNTDNKTMASSLEKPQSERPEKDKISVYEKFDLASGDNKISDKETESIGEHEPPPGDGQPSSKDPKIFVLETLDFDRPWRVEFYEKSSGDRKASAKSTQSIPEDENSLKTIRLSEGSVSDAFPFTEEEIEQIKGACAKEKQAFDSNDFPPEGCGTPFFGTDITINTRELRSQLKEVLSTAVGVEIATEATAREAKTQREQEEDIVVVELKSTSFDGPLGREDFKRTAEPASSTTTVLTESSVATNQRGRWRLRTFRLRRLFSCCFGRR